MRVAERRGAEGLSSIEPPPVTVLRAAAVTKRYADGGSRVALDGIDLEVARGEMVAIVGPSGSGKSTLLHLFGALDVATAGEVWFEGAEISRMSEQARTETRRTRVGFVFQQYNLIPVLSAAENIALPLAIAGVAGSERDRRVARVVDVVGLPASVLARRPRELSGGEQQRAAIARALISDPGVILADEPTGALDTDSGREVLAALRRASTDDGRTVVLATHDPAAAAVADEIVRLRDGRIADRHRVDPISIDAMFRAPDLP